MNKFEKKFAIIDIFIFLSILAYIIVGFKLDNFKNVIVGILIMSYYLFSLKKGIWKYIQKQEKESIDFTNVDSIGEKTFGQWKK